jgi:hypothetical protein
LEEQKPVHSSEKEQERRSKMNIFWSTEKLKTKVIF